MQLQFDDKKILHVQPMVKLLREGEKNVDRISITGPAQYEGMDLSTLHWAVCGNYADYPETAMQTLTGATAGGDLTLTWIPDETFTAHHGGMDLILVGTDDGGSRVIKITSDMCILIRPAARRAGAGGMSALERIYNAILGFAREIRDWVETAKSWAVGGTGMRKDEETNNAKYFAEQAAGAATEAEGSAAAAAGSASDAETSKNTTSELVIRAEAAAEDAALIKNGADAAAEAAGKAAGAAQEAAAETKVVKENLPAIQAIGENIEAIQNAPNAAARAEAAATKAEDGASRAETAAGKAAGSADAASKSAGEAAASVQVVKDNAESIQTVVINLDAILHAAANALAAQAAAESAGSDADRAEDAADRAQSIAQGQLGYYPSEAQLKADHAEGQNGQWAIIGETDTIWVWDSDTETWSDSGNKTDLSQYYTKNEADVNLDELQKAMNTALTQALAEQKSETGQQIEKLQTALEQQITEANTAAQNAASRRWELSVTAEGWQQEEDGRYTKTIQAEGVTAGTRLSPGVGAKPGGAATLEEKKAVQTALGCISELETGAGTVTLTCYEQVPEMDFDIILEEVR